MHMELKSMEWTKDFSIDFFVDKDHRHLIDIINDLVELINTNGSRSDFARILSAMTDYSLFHFKKEEAYMQAFNYPKLEEHKKYHKEYVLETVKYNFALLNYDTTEPMEVINFLKSWWTKHIMVIDADYQKYKNEVHSDAVYGRPQQ